MSDDPKTPSNVVPLFRKEPFTPRFKRGHFDGKLCPHTPMTIDATARRLFCANCKTELDPYMELAKLANDEHHYQWLYSESGRLRRENEELDAENKRLKAQRRRLRKPMVVR